MYPRGYILPPSPAQKKELEGVDVGRRENASNVQGKIQVHHTNKMASSDSTYRYNLRPLGSAQF